MTYAKKFTRTFIKLANQITTTKTPRALSLCIGRKLDTLVSLTPSSTGEDVIAKYGLIHGYVIKSKPVFSSDTVAYRTVVHEPTVAEQIKSPALAKPTKVTVNKKGVYTCDVKYTDHYLHTLYDNVDYPKPSILLGAMRELLALAKPGKKILAKGRIPVMTRFADGCGFTVPELADMHIAFSRACKDSPVLADNIIDCL